MITAEEVYKIFETLHLLTWGKGGDMSGAELIVDNEIKVWRVSNNIFIYDIGEAKTVYAVLNGGNTEINLSNEIMAKWMQGYSLRRIKADMELILRAAGRDIVYNTYDEVVKKAYDRIFHNKQVQSIQVNVDTINEFHERLKTAVIVGKSFMRKYMCGKALYTKNFECYVTNEGEVFLRFYGKKRLYFKVRG
ncbi:MAG: hypothetical protein QXO37_06815 [Candidatus Nitrosocaldaceae archaeon]